jgi:CubicO group peptidase (beta-lactamase class C family)
VKIVVALLFSLLAAMPVRAQSDPQERIGKYVREAMAGQNVPGVAVAIIEQGKLVLVQGYGYANLEHSIPVTADTIFQSGSVGKQFTAVAVMLLVEDGKLGLDDSIAKWLPKAPKAWKPITVRQLLNHTSGIPGLAEAPMPHLDFQRDYTDEELVAAAFKLKLVFPAGSRWSYSNTGYDLLGVIVGKASGKFYGDLLKERVFDPLGMKTARVISESDLIPNRAAGYRLENGVIKNQEWVAPSHNISAAGALYFSLKDLIGWDNGLRAKAILKPASWEVVYEPAQLGSGARRPYGFGWNIAEYGGRPHIWHNGRWQGFVAQISRFGPDDRTVIVLCNLATCKVGHLVQGIVGVLDRPQ